MFRSIQLRLLTLTLLSILAAALLTGWFAYREASHEVDELINSQLVQYARIMLALAHAGDNDEVKSPNFDEHYFNPHVIFQIWEHRPDGDKLLLRSPGAPRAWPPGVAMEGYSALRFGGTDWRTFAAADDQNQHYVMAALDLHLRNELTTDIAWVNLKPYLFSLPILSLVLAWVISRGLAPLRGLEADLATRSPERLDALPETDLPRELRPLVLTMNRLFGRVAQVLENERRFTSDAAHELRTPLAAMKAQLQVAQRAPDGREVHGAIGKALHGADRMTHLVAELLTLARLEGAQAAPGMTAVALSDLVEEAAGEMRAVAVERGLDLATTIEPALNLNGNPDLLRVLVRNLLDNALRYVPGGGHVLLSLAGQDADIVLRVADDGPGVAAAERSKLGLRFHRFEQQAVEGVGLGLSIVRRIAELHGAELEFGDGLNGKGLGVTLRFPSQAVRTPRQVA